MPGCHGVHEVVLATSNLPEDDPLEAFTLNGKVRIVRGAPENVAERMLEAAALTKADIIIRVTGDCPVVSPEVLQYLIDRHLQKEQIILRSFQVQQGFPVMSLLLKPFSGLCSSQNH